MTEDNGFFFIYNVRERVSRKIFNMFFGFKNYLITSLTGTMMLSFFIFSVYFGFK
jgi:hypothetical protein